MTLEAPSFHLHQLLPRQPEHAAARLRDDAQGHRIKGDLGLPICEVVNG